MLVLKRKVGDSLLIGDDISIKIVSIDPNGKVNIGIDAPKDVLILRSELKQATDVNLASADIDENVLNAFLGK